MLASDTEAATSLYHVSILCQTTTNMDRKVITAQGIMQGTGSSPIFMGLCSMNILQSTQ